MPLQCRPSRQEFSLTCIYGCMRFYCPKREGILSYRGLKKSYFITWKMPLTLKDQQVFNDLKDLFKLFKSVVTDIQPSS